MILLAYICSDQTLPTPSLDNTALSWIHAELPWQAVECLFFFFFSLIDGRGIVRAFPFDYIISCHFSSSTHFLCWVIAHPGAARHSLHLPAMPDDDNDDSPVICHVRLAAALDELSFRPAIQVSVSLLATQNGMYLIQCENITQPHTKYKHINRGVCALASNFTLYAPWWCISL